MADTGTWVQISAGETIVLYPGDAPMRVRIAFSPENASNKRFKVSNKRRSVAAVTDIDPEGTFTVTPIMEGTTTIGVTPVNNINQGTFSFGIEVDGSIPKIRRS